MSTTFDPDAAADDAPVIVDFDVIEKAKENIQPLARGRRVTALQSLLTTPHAQRESRLAATRNRLRMNVQLALENSANEDGEDDEEEIEGADPLEAYTQYVDWVVENYPQGHSAESGLLELLEEATRVLKDHQGGKWRGDLRYLKLWTLYASYVEKPAVIYKFCMINEIGTSHALLYEEFAIALERAGRKTQADETYQLGLARRAAPIERLESKYKEFQKRMMASPTLPSESTPTDSQPSAAPVKRRAVLGESSARSSTRPTRSSSRAVSNPTPSALPSAATPRPQPNARIPVFVDSPNPDGENDENKEEEPPSAWPELGTRKSRVKENIREATKAAGTTLKQPGAARRQASSGTSKIAVYRDPTPGSEEGTNTQADEDNITPPKASGSKSRGKSIAVFRDEPEPAPAPSTSKVKSSGKSSIAVFRDEDPPVESPPAPTTRSTRSKAPSKSSIAVFRDDDPPAESSPASTTRTARSGKAPAKSSIAVFRDDEPEEKKSAAAKSSKARTTSKSSIAVFRDEPDPPAKPKAGSTSHKSKSSIAVFRDDDATSPDATAPKSKAPAVGKSKIAVFRDDDAEAEEKPKAVALGKAKSSIPVFRDEPAPSTRPISPPSFTPYRDEEALASPTKMARSRSLGAGLGITGLGSAGSMSGAKISSEAEALRRDPLKNYAEDERVELDDA